MSSRPAQWPVWIGVLAGAAVLAAVVLVVASLSSGPGAEADEPATARAPDSPTAPLAEAPARPDVTPAPGAQVGQDARAARTPSSADRREALLDAPAPAPDAPPVDPAEEARVVALHEQVRESVAVEFEKARPEIVAKCFGGAPSTGRPSTGITYNVVVDESGREIARGTTESRDETPAEVRSCLRQNGPPPVKVAPPGRTVSVDVFISYP